MEKLLTLEEVAKLTRATPSTLRYWRHLGNYGPPSARIGRRVVYREAEVIAWIERQFATGGAA